MKHIDADKLLAEINDRLHCNGAFDEVGDCAWHYDQGMVDAYNHIKEFITSLLEEQEDEQPEYGYLYTEYIHGRKPRWSVGDELAHYICTSNEEGEYPLGKIVNVEFDEEDGWVYTFEDESMLDEQSLVEEEAYKKN